MEGPLCGGIPRNKLYVFSLVELVRKKLRLFTTTGDFRKCVEIRSLEYELVISFK